MIKSKGDYLFYLEADRIALERPKLAFRVRLKQLVYADPIWKFQRLMRKLEYYQNCQKGGVFRVQKVFLARKFQRLSLRLGFSIPLNVFGPGLSIAHYGTIIVNTGSQVGANCRIHVGVNIGTAAGHKDKAPRLGNNIYIGPGAKIYGDIFIGDNIAIGANAVVNRSFEENGIAIAGVPAKEIGKTDTSKLLIKATDILQRA